MHSLYHAPTPRRRNDYADRCIPPTGSSRIRYVVSCLTIQPRPRLSLTTSNLLPRSCVRPFSGAIAGRHGPHAPLMTSAMREMYDREHGKSKKQYDFIRIRVRFSDRTQIERTFPHNATILDVYDAVDHVLWEEHDHGTYVLFQSPPRRNFPRTHTTDTLRSLGFAPAAVLSIQWSNPSKNGTLCYDQQASCSHSGPH